MAVTRSTAARARLFDLLALPDDLLLTVARHALAMEVPAALRLLQTCKALHGMLRQRVVRWHLCANSKDPLCHSDFRCRLGC